MNNSAGPEGERQQEHDEPDVHPLGGEDSPRCAQCKRVLVGKRADATWCSARCRMRWKRKHRRLEAAKFSYLAVHPDANANLTELYERATVPAHWADLESGCVDPDLMEYSDQFDVDDDEPGTTGPVGLSAFDASQQIQRLRADVQARLDQALQPFAYSIRRNYGGSVELAAQRDARIRAIVAPFLREFEIIDQAERDHWRAEAVEQANKPWAVQERRDRAKGIANTAAFGADLGKPSRITGGAPGPGREVDEAFQFPERASVFGNDSQLWRHSSIARSLGNRVISPDGWT